MCIIIIQEHVFDILRGIYTFIICTCAGDLGSN